MKQAIFKIILMIMLVLPMTAANLFLYSDGACPAGTTDSGKYVQVIKSKVLGVTLGPINVGCDNALIGGYTTCYAAAVGNNLQCHELTASGVYNNNASVCYWHTITYDSLRLCQWTIP